MSSTGTSRVVSANRDSSRSALHHFDVGDGQHPTAIIALRIVENVQLPRMQPADVGLFPQRTVDSVGENLALVQEGPGKGPTRAAVADEPAAPPGPGRDPA